jgi:23S rRNA (pseudouridine1915-N3)-methyltransferase
MRIRLVCVGRPRDRELGLLHDRYAARIERMGVRYDADWVAEVRPGGRFSDDHVRQREARNVLEKLPGPGTIVATDRRGASWTSEQLAPLLERWATPALTLVVGGPLGLHPDVLSRADHAWSLSPLTFPHEVVRVLVVEQLYRALTILRGAPYHK